MKISKKAPTLCFLVLLSIKIPVAVAKPPATISHPTCNIYLPTKDLYTRGNSLKNISFVFGSANEKISHWAHLEPLFKAKGYHPVSWRERELSSIQDENYLLADIDYSYRLDKNIHGSGDCYVNLNIRQITTHEEKTILERKSPSLGMISEDKDGDGYPDCDSAEETVFNSLPTCQVHSPRS